MRVWLPRREGGAEIGFAVPCVLGGGYDGGIVVGDLVCLIDVGAVIDTGVTEGEEVPVGAVWAGS